MEYEVEGQGQEEDQRGPGERLSERTVKLVNRTKRMPWIAVNGKVKVKFSHTRYRALGP